jgi:hypothetical protein
MRLESDLLLERASGGAGVGGQLTDIQQVLRSIEAKVDILAGTQSGIEHRTVRDNSVASENVQPRPAAVAPARASGQNRVSAKASSTGREQGK